MNFTRWLGGQRRVVVSTNVATCSIRVAVERADGQCTVREISDHVLQCCRGSPYDVIASAFRDGLDRAAIRLLGRAQIDAGRRRMLQPTVSAPAAVYGLDASTSEPVAHSGKPERPPRFARPLSRRNRALPVYRPR